MSPADSPTLGELLPRLVLLDATNRAKFRIEFIDDKAQSFLERRFYPAEYSFCLSVGPERQLRY
jgi:hypothetical protein